MDHDATNFVALLRDHLAAHDRPIAFLFGAGTSCAVNSAPIDPATGKAAGFKPLIPDVAALTTECQGVIEASGANGKASWKKLCAECTSLDIPANIESLLTRVRAKLDALTGTDALDGLTRDDWLALDQLIRKHIAQAADPKSIPKVLPHHNFTRWLRNTTRRTAVEVFTTNYDVLFEATFDQLRMPHFDGFIGSQYAYFSPESVEDDSLLPSASWVRLWKIHGSVSWTVEDVNGSKRITRGRPAVSGELILPSNRKYDESRKQPYRALMDRLTRVLAREDALIVTCGYSFGDQHINAILLDALDQQPRTHLIALSYPDITANDVVATWAASRRNIIYAGPSAGVLLGRLGSWRVAGKPDAQLETTTSGLLRPAPSKPDQVRLHAGDFTAFCSFLASMAMSPTEKP